MSSKSTHLYYLAEMNLFIFTDSLRSGLEDSRALHIHRYHAKININHIQLDTVIE